MPAPWKHFDTINITHSELSQDEDERTLWHLSNMIMDTYQSDGSENILEYLEEHLEEGLTYYVFHDIRTHKGKQIVKAGRILLSTKSAILDFVNQDIDDNGYATPLRIMPQIAPSSVLKIHEGDGISCFSRHVPNNYLIVNDIRISHSEMYVGATDAHRWFADMNDGFSGVDAATLAAIVLSDLKSNTPQETADLTSTVTSEQRLLIFQSLADLSRIAWEIKNKGMDLNTAKKEYFGQRVKQN